MRPAGMRILSPKAPATDNCMSAVGESASKQMHFCASVGGGLADGRSIIQLQLAAQCSLFDLCDKP